VGVQEERKVVLEESVVLVEHPVTEQTYKALLFLPLSHPAHQSTPRPMEFGKQEEDAVQVVQGPTQWLEFLALGDLDFNSTFLCQERLHGMEVGAEELGTTKHFKAPSVGWAEEDREAQHQPRLRALQQQMRGKRILAGEGEEQIRAALVHKMVVLVVLVLL
jgi:hypothetical protein